MSINKHPKMLKVSGASVNACGGSVPFAEGPGWQQQGTSGQRTPQTTAAAELRRIAGEAHARCSFHFFHFF